MPESHIAIPMGEGIADHTKENNLLDGPDRKIKIKRQITVTFYYDQGVYIYNLIIINTKNKDFYLLSVHYGAGTKLRTLYMYLV